MAGNVLVLAEHNGGRLSDTTFELLGKAKELAAAWGGQADVALLGAADLAAELGAADRVLTVDHPALASYTSEAYEAALRAVVEQAGPRLVLLSTATAGLDLAGALSVTWDAPLVSYVVGLEPEGDGLLATAQIYGGKLSAEVEIAGERAVCAAVAGSFAADAGKSAG